MILLILPPIGRSAAVFPVAPIPCQPSSRPGPWAILLSARSTGVRLRPTHPFFRPALFLSPERYNARVGLAILCPVTGQEKGYPFEVVLPPGGSVAGVILSDQVKSLDRRARQGERIESLPSRVTEEVLQKLGTLLD